MENMKEKDKFNEIREVFLIGDIEQKTYEIMEDLIKDRKNYSTIKLYINSFGGDTWIGYSIINTLRMLKKKIITVNCGNCYSMAYNIYILGDERLAFKDSMFMIHDGSQQLNGSTQTVRRVMELDNWICQKLNKDIINLTKFNEKKLKIILDKNEDYYFFAKEGILNGTCHKIISSI